jgi:hypothetical protein
MKPSMLDNGVMFVLKLNKKYEIAHTSKFMFQPQPITMPLSLTSFLGSI